MLKLGCQFHLQEIDFGRRRFPREFSNWRMSYFNFVDAVITTKPSKQAFQFPSAFNKKGGKQLLPSS